MVKQFVVVESSWVRFPLAPPRLEVSPYTDLCGNGSSHRLQTKRQGERNINMAKIPANSHKAWSSKQEAELKSLANHNTPTRVIGLKMGRSESSIQSKASALGVSLKPTNQSPYGTKKK